LATSAQELLTTAQSRYGFHRLALQQRNDAGDFFAHGAAVERIFADWKCRRSLRRARYVGLAKNLSQCLLLAFTHNLRRWAVPTG
jgi:IS5 family transposase